MSNDGMGMGTIKGKKTKPEHRLLRKRPARIHNDMISNETLPQYTTAITLHEKKNLFFSNEFSYSQ